MKRKKEFLKGWIFIITVAVCVGIICSAAFAAGQADTIYKVFVNGKIIDLETAAVYCDSGVVMVPLRKVGEALGYKVDWDSQTGEITIDDEYIQYAALYGGSREAVFKGRLKVINMSRTIENERATTILDGVAYVPLKFFEEFLNETNINGSVVSISPSTCEITE